MSKTQKPIKNTEKSPQKPRREKRPFLSVEKVIDVIERYKRKEQKVGDEAQASSLGLISAFAKGSLEALSGKHFN